MIAIGRKLNKGPDLMTEFFIGMTVGAVIGTLALAYLFASAMIEATE